MSPDKLVRMANQIAAFFTSAEPDEASAMIAAHINEFWEPRMRRQMLEAVEQGAASELDAAASAAMALINDPRKAA